MAKNGKDHAAPMQEGKRRPSAEPKQGSLTAMETARLMQSKRTNEGTKQNYKSKTNIMVKWMAQHEPAALNAKGGLRVPTPAMAVMKFFGDLSAKAVALAEATDADAASLPTPMSVSAVRGYRSALVDQYRVVNKVMDSKLDMELSSMLDGYEKAICELKQRGRMSIKEGKRHLKWEGYGRREQIWQARLCEYNEPREVPDS